MQLRVSKFLKKEATGLPWLGTFHSISAKILRKHAEAAGLKSNFSIYQLLLKYILGIFFLYPHFLLCIYFSQVSIDHLDQ